MTWNDLSQASLEEIMAWANDQPWCRAMADCEQDERWHSEGNVWTHTQMVYAELPRLDEWSSLTLHQRTLLVFTALFHDAAKPLTSQVDAGGRITTPKHAAKGSALLDQCCVTWAVIWQHGRKSPGWYVTTVVPPSFWKEQIPITKSFRCLGG